MKTPIFRELGSANIFEMKSVGELTWSSPVYSHHSVVVSLGGLLPRSRMLPLSLPLDWATVGGGGARRCHQWRILDFFAYKRDTVQSCYARTEIFHVWNVSLLDEILGILMDWVRPRTVLNLRWR